MYTCVLQYTKKNYYIAKGNFVKVQQYIYFNSIIIFSVQLLLFFSRTLCNAYYWIKHFNICNFGHCLTMLDILCFWFSRCKLVISICLDISLHWTSRLNCIIILSLLYIYDHDLEVWVFSNCNLLTNKLIIPCAY